MRLAADPGARSGRVLGTVAALALLGVVAASSWFAAIAFVSPEQREAAAAPPEPGDVTAVVEHGVLARTVSVELEVVRRDRVAQPIPGGDGLRVITAQPVTASNEIPPGGVVTEVNGRPVLALEGAFPFYRDLARGDSGPDVTQLQSALQDMGYSASTSGVFDWETEYALQTFYDDNGYEVPEQGTASVPTGSNSLEPVPVPVTSPPAPPATHPILAMNEFLVFPALPVTAVSTPHVGVRLDADTAVVVESGPIVAAGSAPIAVAVQLDPGLTGSSGARESRADIVIDRIDLPEDSADEARVVVRRVEGEFGMEQLGEPLVALFELERVAEDALLVPTSAIADSGTAQATILRRTSSGDFEGVRVVELGSLAGQSAVQPVADGSLAEGDIVKLG